MTGRRRPHRSLSGPAISWPAASPIRQAVSDSCTREAATPKSRASAGNAGRYRSSESGPTAVNAPSRTSRRRPRLLWWAGSVTRQIYLYKDMLRRTFVGGHMIDELAEGLSLAVIDLQHVLRRTALRLSGREPLPE